MIERLGFAVSMSGWRVGVVAHSRSSADVLDRYVFPWLAREPLDVGDVDTLVELAPCRGGLRVLAEGREVGVAASVEEAVAPLTSWLDGRFAARTSHLVVHAGAAALGDAAVLVPGRSHAGKSTLTRALLQRGFRYYSDEYALIDDAGRLCPYPRALMLRDNRPTARPLLASECGGLPPGGPVRVALVLALSFAPERGWAVERIPQGAMLIELLRNTPQAMAERQDLVAGFARALAGAACYLGTRGEAEEAAARIADLLTAVRG
jgi:hypothetical protein